MLASTRGREQGSRVRRARGRDIQASSEMHRAAAHEEGLYEEAPVEGEEGESIDRSELNPFLRDIEAPLSPPGEGLTARDILEARSIFEEGGGGYEVDNDVEESVGQLLAGPLRDAELGLDQHATRQVILVCLVLAPFLVVVVAASTINILGWALFLAADGVVHTVCDRWGYYETHSCYDTTVQ